MKHHRQHLFAFVISDGQADIVKNESIIVRKLNV